MADNRTVTYSAFEAESCIRESHLVLFYDLKAKLFLFLILPVRLRIKT